MNVLMITVVTAQVGVEFLAKLAHDNSCQCTDERLFAKAEWLIVADRRLVGAGQGPVGRHRLALFCPRLVGTRFLDRCEQLVGREV